MSRWPYWPSLPPPAEAQNQLWLNQFGSTDRDRGWAVTSDNAGGAFVGGFTRGVLGGPRRGGRDAYLARHDGDQLWIIQFGTRSDDQVRSLTPDGAGGVIMAGWTNGSLGGTSAGGNDAYVARYDSAGNQLWIDQFGTIGEEVALSVVADSVGGAFVSGWTTGSLVGPNAGGLDGLLARYNSAGSQLWIRQFGTSGDERAFSVTPDGGGGVLVAGATGGSLGGPNVGDQDAFLARYDGAGNQLWIRQFGTSVYEQALSNVSDGQGGAWITGDTAGSLGGPNGGGHDVFLAHYDDSGNLLSLTQAGGTEGDNGIGIAPDGTGGVMIIGHALGDWGGPNLGGFDAILARFNSAGDLLWVHKFGTFDNDNGHAIMPVGVGEVIVTGYTSANLGGPLTGESDIFLARFLDAPCYADCDQSTGVGILDLFDFLCFQGSFVSGEPYACDCDTSTGPLVCDLFDFLCFQGAFVGGCP